jgi:hypothetical protein
MGRYTTIYIGAGIEIPTQKGKYQAQENRCQCKVHHTDFNFCNSCGDKIKVYSVEKEYTLHSEDLIGSENFFTIVNKDSTYLFSNFGHGLLETNENEALSINLSLIDSLKNDFNNKHEKDIVILKEKTNLDIQVSFLFLHSYI